jgi:hypothetical protein
MNASASAQGRAPNEWTLERQLGCVRGPAPGPTLIAVGGIHGNEPAGIEASRLVLSRLEGLAPQMRGEFTALAGNLQALSQGKRFLARDLNRQWTPERIAGLKREGSSGSASLEDREQLELLAAIEEVLLRARGPVYLLDLHTTSAPGVPFSVAGSSPRSLDFALQFPSVILMGLQDMLGGVMTEYFASRRVVALAVEGGQHQDRAAVECHESLLWMALRFLRQLPPGSGPGMEVSRRRLEEARGTLPRVVDVQERHSIRPEDHFVMEPGFDNIQPVGEGVLLARDRAGEIRARKSRLLVMPLYQALGDDGFFLGRARGPWRLRVQAALRIFFGELRR